MTPAQAKEAAILYETLAEEKAKLETIKTIVTPTQISVTFRGTNSSNGGVQETMIATDFHENLIDIVDARLLEITTAMTGIEESFNPEPEA